MPDKFVWLIGGSIMSEPMCKEIKRRGYNLLLTDGNPECHCRNLADFFHTASAYDVEDHVNFGRMVSQGILGFREISAVLTIGTDAGPTVSALSELFDLPGIGRQTAELVKNKIAMRQKLMMPEPFFFVHHQGDRPGFFEHDKFPMAVKQPDQAGSRGFEIAEDNTALHRILETRQDEGDLLLEQLLIGEDVMPGWREKYGFDTSEAAFDFFVEDGKVIYANGALRLFWVDQPGIEAGHLNPYFPDKKIMSLAVEAAKGLGVKWGPFKIDVKKDDRYGWCLLECATRLSGGWDHMYTSPLATGKDVTGVMLDVALGGKVDYNKLAGDEIKSVCCYAPKFEPGSISGWLIDENLAVKHVFPMVRDEIKPLMVNQERPLVIIAKAEKYNQALEKCLYDAQYIKPEYKSEASE